MIVLLLCSFMHRITQKIVVDWDEIFHICLFWPNVKVIRFLVHNFPGKGSPKAVTFSVNKNCNRAAEPPNLI